MRLETAAEAGRTQGVSPGSRMTGLRRAGRLLAGVLLAEVLAPGKSWACAACYGQSDSPLAAGMNWGIMSLLGFIVFVLGAVAGFFIFLARRSAALKAAAALEAARAEPIEPAFAPEFVRRRVRRSGLALSRRFCRRAWGLAPWKRHHRHGSRTADTRSFARG